MDIQWYPGHMARAKRLVKENLKLADVVIEVLDARIPSSSRNPDINEIAGTKPRLVVLNKSDLADPGLTRQWKNIFIGYGHSVVTVNSVSGKGIREVPGLVRQMFAPKMASLLSSGRRSRAARCLVLGIPNVGKSLFINKLVGRRVTRTEDKPGVTRGRQWIRVAGNIELMDTPGILWPKFEDPDAGFRLAVTGAIKEEVFDPVFVAIKLLRWLAENYPAALRERYKLDYLAGDPEEHLKAIGIKRGFLISGGAIDNLKSAQNILKEFREGKLGQYTLDKPDIRLSN